MFSVKSNRITGMIDLENIKELIIAASPCGILVVDKYGIIIGYNENLKRHWLFRDVNLLNKKAVDFLLYEAEDSRMRYRNPLQETLDTGRALQRDVRLRAGVHRHRLICRVWTRLLYGKKGNIVGVCGAFLDLTPLHSNQKQLQEMNRLLAETQSRSAAHHIEAIRGFAAAIAARDDYTRWHSEKVAEYAQQICLGLGIKEEYADMAYLAGLLHDVGKIGVPESILTKPGRLDKEEFEIIKKHPDTGVAIMQSMQKMKDILNVIRHHHERYDGSGYPAGLIGESIPLLSRVLAVADAFDAMTSDRAYRKAFTLPDAIREIKNNAGTQFDPRIARSFVKMIQ